MAKSKTEVVMLPVDKIQPSPFQPRETFDKDKINELAGSIDESGLLQPILVRPKGDIWQIIAGERRWRAHQVKGIPLIAAVVRDVPDDLEAMELSLAENWARQDLTDIEKEKFIYQLWQMGGPDKKGRYERYKNHSDMSQKTGINLATLTGLIKAHEERLQNPTLEFQETPYWNLTATRSLEPEIRKQVLELGLQKAELQQFVKTLKTTIEQDPEVAKQAVALVAAGRSVQDVQSLVQVLQGQSPEVTKSIVTMVQQGQSVKDAEKFVDVIKDQTPDLQQHAINLMQKKSQPVEDVKRQVEFLAAAPEKIRQEVIATTEDIPVPTAVQIITPVEISDEDVAKWKKGDQEIEEWKDKVRNDPAIQARIKLRNNYSAHSALLRVLGDAFDPITGQDWHSLKWPSGLNLQEAQKKTAELLRASKKEKGEEEEEQND